MFGRIGDPLLSDAVEACTEKRRQSIEAAAGLELEPGPAAAPAIPACDETFKARGEAKLVDVRRAQPHQRASQRPHHMGRCLRDCLAFGDERRTFRLGSLPSGRSNGADRGETLAEFVMKLARQMRPLLVLNGYQPLRQLVALRERRLQRSGEGIEHVADCRQLGQIEGRQAGRKIVRRQLLET